MFDYGIIEDINDPKKLGRVRVRVFGLHTKNKILIPTEGLPWATVVQPTTSAANSGVGITPRMLQGSMVMVAWADDAKQFPIVIGTIASEIQDHLMSVDGDLIPRGNSTDGFQDPDGIYPKEDYINTNDLPKKARDSDFEFPRVGISFKNSIFDIVEPTDIRGKHVYPFNQVRQSQSGHLEEWDDTPANERINLQHASGTFTEYRPDGSQVTKILHNRYQLIADSDNLYIGGDVNVHVNGNANMFVQKNSYTHIVGDQYIQVDGNKTEVIQGNSQIQITGNDTRKVGGILSSVIGGIVKWTSDTWNSYSSNGTNIDGGEIHLNSGNTSAHSIDDLGVLVPSEYDVGFAEPLIYNAGVYAAFDEPETIDETPSTYPADNRAFKDQPKEATYNTSTTREKSAEKEKVNDVDYSMSLSQNYVLGDLTIAALFSHQLVEQHGRSVTDLAHNLKLVALNIIEPLREAYPDLRINSGFRKGTKGRSQHEKGQAVDIQFPAFTPNQHLEVAKWMVENLAFDQLIFEHGRGIWIHASFNETSNRRQVLTMKNGKFESGLRLYY